MNLKLFITALACSLFLNSCKDTVDPNANPQTFELDVKFNPMVKNTATSLGKYYLLNGTDSIMVERLDFYVDRMTFKSVNTFKTDSIFLFSMASNSKTFSFKTNKLPSKIDSINFHLGLDDFINHGDPKKYPAEHSLSSWKNMSWTWASGYRFVIFEGKIISNGVQKSFSFHTGLEFKNFAYLAPVKTLSATTKNEINIAFNLDRIFYPTNGNNILYNSGELQAHADPSDAALTDKVAKNVAKAFSIQ